MRIDRRVREALEETGLPWMVVHGKRHLKLYVGDQLAGILPLSGKDTEHGKALLNTISQIRRVARGTAARGA